MVKMFSTIRRVAPHYRSILITGQTGTGKDLVARAVHQLSPGVFREFCRRKLFRRCRDAIRKRVIRPCEGFVHRGRSRQGRPRGACKRRELFLDEIGDMPPSTQAKLLRVLQNQEIQRVGPLTPGR